jgi:hypothetical protein
VAVVVVGFKSLADLITRSCHLREVLEQTALVLLGHGDKKIRTEIISTAVLGTESLAICRCLPFQKKHALLVE